jgi:regulator of sirC expression with transglutaminase-like and TPR domain
VRVMSGPTQQSPSSSHPFSEGRLAALLVLLADDDPKIRQSIRATLLSGGPGVFAQLADQRFHSDPAVRKAVAALLLDEDRRKSDEAFLAFVLTHGEQFNLEEAVWLFAKTTRPNLNGEHYQAQLDEWATWARARIMKDGGPIATLRAMNTVLFGELGFTGMPDSDDHPAASYLDWVMDRRTGSPLSLCLLYMFFGMRLGIPLAAIGIPGNFLCRFQSPREEFYLDPANGGGLLTRVQCKRRIASVAVEYDESLLSPLTSRRVLQRLVAGLHLTHKERGETAEAQRLQRYLVALSR